MAGPISDHPHRMLVNVTMTQFVVREKIQDAWRYASSGLDATEPRVVN